MVCKLTDNTDHSFNSNFLFVFSFDHLSCAGLPRAPVDPCSRESVLKVLKESRKRVVEDEDGSFTAEQKSKRRYAEFTGTNYLLTI